MGMMEKKNENLTASTLPNFGIIFFECDPLVILKAAHEKKVKEFQSDLVCKHFMNVF